jgi:hypothetical protein
MASGGNERSRLAMAQRWDLIADRNNVDAKGALKNADEGLRLARKSNLRTKLALIEMATEFRANLCR